MNNRMFLEHEEISLGNFLPYNLIFFLINFFLRPISSRYFNFLIISRIRVDISTRLQYRYQSPPGSKTMEYLQPSERIIFKYQNGSRRHLHIAKSRVPWHLWSSSGVPFYRHGRRRRRRRLSSASQAALYGLRWRFDSLYFMRMLRRDEKYDTRKGTHTECIIRSDDLQHKYIYKHSNCMCSWQS